MVLSSAEEQCNPKKTTVIPCKYGCGAILVFGNRATHYISKKHKLEHQRANRALEIQALEHERALGGSQMQQPSSSCGGQQHQQNDTTQQRDPAAPTPIQPAPLLLVAPPPSQAPAPQVHTPVPAGLLSAGSPTMDDVRRQLQLHSQQLLEISTSLQALTKLLGDKQDLEQQPRKRKAT